MQITINKEKEMLYENFIVTDAGVFYSDGKEHYQICSRLEIVALVRDKTSDNWGRLLEFDDADGNLHRWSMPMELLKGSGDDLRGELLRMGLVISPLAKARSRLVEYIIHANPLNRLRCVNRIGWHEHVFVLPHKTIGELSHANYGNSENNEIHRKPETGERTHKINEQLLLQSDLTSNNYGQCGTLYEWQEYIAKYCIGNSRLVFAVSAAFAAMLLYPIQMESGGIHFLGESSSGKTTALRVAASIYGPAEFLQRWRSTANGLESLAAQHSDTLLVLDELAQLDAKEASETAYLLANGTGKTRATKTGALKARQLWRLLFLSAGEISLAQLLQENGRKSKAGHSVRLVDIPAVTHHGIYEDLHGHSSGAEISKALIEATEKYHGVPCIQFLEAVTRMSQMDTLRSGIESKMALFTKRNLPENASGQVKRVADRFALISAAGELATNMGITAWPDGEAQQAASKCFQAYLEQRGGISNQENHIILSQVKSFFEVHGSSRFELLGDMYYRNQEKINNRVGFKKIENEETWFYVLPEAFKQEICKDHDPRTVTKLLIEKGWLSPAADGRSTKPERLPNLPVTRCYVITPDMWKA